MNSPFITSPYEQLVGLLRSLGRYMLGTWAFVFMLYGSVYLYHDYEDMRDRLKVKSEIIALQKERFEDYMVYHRVLPAKTIAEHGAEIWHKSDAEAIKLPDDGLEIEYKEHIMCDMTPYDGMPSFSYYAMVKTTRSYWTELKPRPSSELLASTGGFPAMSPVTGAPIKYPMDDSDCYLQITIIQHHEHGIKKVHQLKGEVALVRSSKTANNTSADNQ